jgi:hypothetical protein
MTSPFTPFSILDPALAGKQIEGPLAPLATFGFRNLVLMDDQGQIIGYRFHGLPVMRGLRHM